MGIGGMNKSSVWLFTNAHPCAVLNVVNVELHGNVKAVQKITPKHQSIHWSVHCMDPPYTQRHSGLLPENPASSFQAKAIKASLGSTWVYLRGSWMCSLASVRSVGRRWLYRRERCHLASLTTPSSHRAPGSEVWAGSARKPEIIQYNQVNRDRQLRNTRGIDWHRFINSAVTRNKRIWQGEADTKQSYSTPQQLELRKKKILTFKGFKR